jgi:FAD/FMN-containing dehydrogenase
MASYFQQFKYLDNFGHSLRAGCYLFNPGNADEIRPIFEMAKQAGLTITVRGAGKSYNDASLNGGGIVADLQRLNRILAWNPQTGLATVEPGVTTVQLWQHVLPDGWWPPVVSGTMATTLGGCLGMNIHGKNNYRAGPIGEHVTRFTALLPTGDEVTCTPESDPDLFYAMIGGLGMLGVFTSITLKMEKIHSGLLKVHAFSVPDLDRHLKAVFENAPDHDYTVGWLDPTAGGGGLGRGQVHTADYLPMGEDPAPETTLQVGYQTLPATILGVPKSILHYFMAPFMNNLGAWGVNTGKYLLSLRSMNRRQSHAAFHFLLDYVPGFELAYGKAGLIEYQTFLPLETAQAVWNAMLTLSHHRSLPAYLGVTKRHRPDRFLLSHAVDGYSLALDFKVSPGNRQKLDHMLQEFDRLVLDGGGRFYFAKNSETHPGSARRFLGSEAIGRFLALKQRCDPDGLLESDLYRRIFLEAEN